MKKFYLSIVFIFLIFLVQAQIFTRSEFITPLSTPWEIVYGPDNFIWVTETGGLVSRIDPLNGSKTVVFTAPDYFAGSPLEKLAECHQPSIGKGTLGLALHPDFLDSASSYIYYVYSYNSGTSAAPATKFKIKRLTWEPGSQSVVNDTDIVTLISTGYDHLGGCLMTLKQNGVPYLFLTIGDHGISDDNYPDCYSPQSSNPNNFTQDPTTQNGKVHRFNIDGTIPTDNPIPGNSFFTRGHRNPQSLMYNYNLDIMYATEHGDHTDDEINILHKGMNYGWKNVRGYHSDNNYPGESDFISNYIPDSSIPNDSLVEPFYSFCATEPDTSSDNMDWCTVAPAGGIYYGNSGIPQWTNSLLVVTLKNGVSTDKELFQFKLQSNGDLVTSTIDNPNPKKFFAADQLINGRLRDITVSPDGKKIYLINNGGASKDKITVYTYDSTASAIKDYPNKTHIRIFPNPATNSILVNFECDSPIKTYSLEIRNSFGETVYRSGTKINHDILINGSAPFTISLDNQPAGLYFLEFDSEGKRSLSKFVVEY